MQRVLLAALLLWPAIAHAQSSMTEATRWRDRSDPAIARETAIAGCTWIIHSGQASTTLLAIAYGQRARHRAAINDRPGAMADFNEAIRLDPRDASLLANRALLRLATGEAASGTADLAAVIAAAGPRDGWPCAARAGLALQRGDTEAAAPDIAEAIRRQPNSAIHLALRAVLHTRQGNPSEAAADWAAAHRLAPAIGDELTSLFGPAFTPP